MYKGYNLKINFTQKDVDNYYQIGHQLYLRNKKIANKKLNELLLINGNLNGSQMQENWFPQIEADIFISHSHKDEITAITLAGYLYSTFGIKSFIDSCLWGYSNDLLKLVDNKFCLQKNGTYNYNKRNFSTSHIHMMLSTALNMMIDKTECLFFLNTPSSISTNGIINSTESPWLYSEITMSKLIRKRKIRRSEKTFSKGGLKGLNESIEYKLDLSHLTEINVNNILDWTRAFNNNNTFHPLDILYYLNQS